MLWMQGSNLARLLASLWLADMLYSQTLQAIAPDVVTRDLTKRCNEPGHRVAVSFGPPRGPGR